MCVNALLGNYEILTGYTGKEINPSQPERLTVGIGKPLQVYCLISDNSNKQVFSLMDIKYDIRNLRNPIIRYHAKSTPGLRQLRRP